MRVRFLSVAARELTEANDYYRSISPDLCRRFISEINAAIGRIKSNPTAWSPIGAKHRRCRTNNFPYGLIYTFLDEDILVVAVSHLHRDPEHWRDRIGT